MTTAQDPPAQVEDAVSTADVEAGAESEDPAATDVVREVVGDSPAPPDSQAASAVGAAQKYNYWTLAPPAVAILLAVATRQVIPSLLIAVLVGSYMLQGVSAFQPLEDVQGSPGIILGSRIAVEQFIIGTFQDGGRIKTILFTLLIGALVGLMGASGGTRAMVDRVSSMASSRRRGQSVGWLAGLVVFFDDYANTMIVGPTMLPICERLRISREKLAYIVDSTAAPVSSIALVGTWVGAEIGFIQSGLDLIADRAPQAISNVQAYEAFFYSIPYRFYAIFALMMVLLVALTGRDFGPMRRAERDAALAPATELAGDPAEPHSGKPWYAILPLGLLVVVSLGLLIWGGWANLDQAAYDGATDVRQKLGMVLNGADTYNSILYGALISTVIAFVVSIAAKALQMGRAMEAVVEGMGRMFPALIILVLAWALSDLMKHLGLAIVAENFLETIEFDAAWLPVTVFLASAVVSFAIGTSWGTMGILCPVVVVVAARLVADIDDPDQALRFFYAAVGSVLAGSVFGDHCSPISDTTVLSSIASGCSLERHVWTQLWYALTAAAVGVACGDVLCLRYGKPLWMGLLAGAVVLLVILLVIGRRPPTAPPPAPERTFDEPPPLPDMVPTDS